MSISATASTSLCSSRTGESTQRHAAGLRINITEEQFARNRPKVIATTSDLTPPRQHKRPNETYRMSTNFRSHFSMSAHTSPASSPESDSPMARLLREADGDVAETQHLNSVILRNSFGASGARLAGWRGLEGCSGMPRRELSYADMRVVFPDVEGGGGSGSGKGGRVGKGKGKGEGRGKGVFDVEVSGLEEAEEMEVEAPRKERLNRWTAHQLRQTHAKKAKGPTTKKDRNAISDMGLFNLLPGELRNSIYRLAFVPPREQQPILITGSDLICGTGACVHKRAPIAAPGIASTCRQIRNELMPLFCAENEFRFDAVMVRNRCVAAWVKSMNTYARLIKRVTLDVLLLDRSNAVGGGTNSQMGSISIECPVARADGKFELVFSGNMLEEKIKESGLRKLVQKLNGDDVGERGRASKLVHMLASDELAELVFRCKK